MPRRNAKRRRGNRRRANRRMHPYLHCISGPVSMPPMGMGFPDGSTRLSLPIDYRQRITITPDSGSVVFAILPTIAGAYFHRFGNTVATVPKQVSNTSTAVASWVSKTVNTTGFIAFGEVATAGTTDLCAKPFGPYQVVSARPLMAAADVMFTGSSMLNGGVCTITKFSTTPTLQGESIYTTPNQIMNYEIQSDAYLAYSSSAAMEVLPARQAFTIRNVAPKPEWQPVTVGKASNFDWAWEQSASTNGAAGPGPIPLEGIMGTMVAYSGLDASASITVDIRVCLELELARGSFPALTKPSPPAQISVWQQVANFARSVPTAYYQAAGRAIGSAALNYFAPGSSGALALTNH